MEIDKNSLLQYTLSAKTPKTVSQVNYAPIVDNNVEASVANISKINLVPVNDSISIGGNELGIIGNISDEKLVNLYETPKIPESNIKFATTYSNFTPSEISAIKRAIYEYCLNSGSTTGSTGNAGGTQGSGTTGGNTTGNTGGTQGSTGGSGTVEEGTEDKKSFLKDFVDVDTMFEYLDRISDGECNKTTGITRAQLVHLTQNEAWEEENSNFWGTLNRIFDVINTQKDGDRSYANDVLTYDEIKTFIGNEIGEDAQAYLNKVNSFANQLQTEYSNLHSNQSKLEFVIEKTRAYLESAGLDKQLKALDRLTSEEDTYHTAGTYSAKVGQIVMAPLESEVDGYTTLGAYCSSCFSWEYDDKTSNKKYPFTVSSYAFDNDDEYNDRGITLNEDMLDWNWYEVVNTLVHELTHATASQWYPDPACEKTNNGFYNLKFDFDIQVGGLFNAGVITQDEYDYYDEHWNSMLSNSSTVEEDEYFNRLMYLLECQWGEYSAYQVDADYVDSIAGDIFNKKGNVYRNNEMTTAVKGENEADIISSHIEEAYNNAGMSISEYARVYGYDVSQINDNDGDGTISKGDTVIDGEDEFDIYSKESKPDYVWATFEKNKGWSWSA